MIFTRKQRIQKQFSKSWKGDKKGKHIEKVQVTTYYLLFIPVYSRHTVLTTDL